MEKETKRCPYCGEVILAVAKKCKHCGEWLNNETKPEVKMPSSVNPQNTVSNIKSAVKETTNKIQESKTADKQKKSVIYYILGAVVVVAIITITTINHPSSTISSYNDEIDSVEIVAVEEMPIDVNEYDSESEYKEKFNEALQEISGIADNAVKYTDGRYIWYNPTTPWGYSKTLSVYDSQTGNTFNININKTPSSDDMVTVHNISEHNGKITVVLEENRNSNGWIEGTYVWTINCSNKNWKCVANGVAGAEIINNGSAVRITTVTIKNPDDPTFMQEYEESTKIIYL